MNKFIRRSSSSTSLSSSSSTSKLLPMIIRNNNNNINNNNHSKTKTMMIGRQHQQQYPLYQCKKHPKHRQSPGVCSLCLSDKLSKVSSSTPTSRYAVIKARARTYYHYSSSSSSSSLSDYDSSCDSSGAASPSRAVTASHHRRIASDVRSSSKAIERVEDGVTLFSKSKSMAHVEKENNFNDEVNNGKKKRKNVGVSKIWANLLRLGKHDQKRVNAEVNNQQQTLPSSSSMVVY